MSVAVKKMPITTILSLSTLTERRYNSYHWRDILPQTKWRAEDFAEDHGFFQFAWIAQACCNSNLCGGHRFRLALCCCYSCPSRRCSASGVCLALLDLPDALLHLVLAFQDELCFLFAGMGGDRFTRNRWRTLPIQGRWNRGLGLGHRRFPSFWRPIDIVILHRSLFLLLGTLGIKPMLEP
jgi:hypothetical protein